MSTGNKCTYLRIINFYKVKLTDSAISSCSISNSLDPTLPAWGHAPSAAHFCPMVTFSVLEIGAWPFSTSSIRGDVDGVISTKAKVNTYVRIILQYQPVNQE